MIPLWRIYLRHYDGPLLGWVAGLSPDDAERAARARWRLPAATPLYVCPC